jgi:hypothetical protein
VAVPLIVAVVDPSIVTVNIPDVQSTNAAFGAALPPRLGAISNINTMKIMDARRRFFDAIWNKGFIDDLL